MKNIKNSLKTGLTCGAKEEFKEIFITFSSHIGKKRKDLENKKKKIIKMNVVSNKEFISS